MRLSSFFAALAFSPTVTAFLLLTHADQSWAQAGNGFFCDETQNPPAMVAAGNGSVIRMITFTSAWAPPPYDPKIRCQVVSARFQSALIRYGSETLFSKITFGYERNQPVWCLSRNSQEQQQGICNPNEEILLTFQNEWQGCKFLPTFLELSLQQLGKMNNQTATAFTAFRQRCDQTFSQRRRATPQDRENFIALNVFFDRSETPSPTPTPVAVNPNSNYILREEGELNQRSPRLESDNSVYQEHTFRGRSGQQITIEVSSREFDTYLFLFSPSGEKIAENDDLSNNNKNSLIEITLPSNGEYRVFVNGYEQGNYGHYLLTVR